MGNCTEHATAWIDLENTVLRERRLSRRPPSHDSVDTHCLE